MAKVTIEEVVHTKRHRYEVRRIADGVFSDWSSPEKVESDPPEIC
ncbi:MAG: hypothetical protein ACOYJ6_15810 [Caulobacterales bacterium]